MTKTYTINGVDCAACGAKIEAKIAKIKGIEDCVLSFMSKKLTIEFEKGDPEALYPEILKAARKIAPDCTITER